MEHRVTDVTGACAASPSRMPDLSVSTSAVNLVSVVLYGSVARGEARHDSDIDLLVICDELPEGRPHRAH